MLDKILEKLKDLDKLKKRGIAVALSALIVLESHFILDNDKKNNKVYLVDLNDKFQNEIVLEGKADNKFDWDSDK